MKGILYDGVGKIVLRNDLPTPILKSNEVLIQVKYCGICGTDIESYKKSGMYGAGTIIGHELSGIITKVGDNVKQLKIGEKVTINPNLPCYNCYWCDRDQENKCKFAPRGLGTLADGGMVEFFNVDQERIHILPDSITLEEAALIEPFAVGLYSVQESGIKLGESAAIYGVGTIGLMVLLALKLAGVGNVFVLDPVESKQKRALDLGATMAFNPKNWKKIQRYTDKIGPPYVFDCVGITETISSSIELIRRGGHIAMVGIDPDIGVLKNFYSIAIKNITFRGIFGYNQDTFRTAIELMRQKRVDLKPLITKIISIDEVPNAFESLANERHEDIKILVKIS